MFNTQGNQNNGEYPLDVIFFPYGNEYRVDITKLSKEQIIEEFVKSSNVFKQEVILHDLLVIGRKMETQEQRGMVALAAELYIKAPDATQRDFLLHLVSVKKIYKAFADAMVSNAMYHETIEFGQPGCSGLTKEELAREKAAAITFEKYTKDIV